MPLMASSNRSNTQRPAPDEVAPRKKQKSLLGWASSGPVLASGEHEVFLQAKAQPGTIKRIELINFMNHGHLTVDLKPGVNFVFGRNGSGKSALLAGCMVALGCKANAVGRGTRMETYIQNGKQSCTARVHLFNGTSDAYKPDLFGPEIIVERVISRQAGGNVYVAKAASGATVYSKLADIADICNHFNIQVANPCVVLTQEKARKFLGTTDDRNRYDFFMQATGLDVTKQNLVEMQAELERMKDNLAAFEDHFPELEEAAATAKKALDDARELEELDDNIADRKAKLRVLHAREAAEKVQAAQAEVEEMSERVDAQSDRLARAREALEEATREHERLVAQNAEETEVSSRTAVIKRMQADKMHKERNRDGLKRKAETSEAQALRQKQKAAAQRQEAETYKKELAARQAQEARELEAKRADLQAKIQAFEAETQAEQAKFDAADRDMAGSKQAAIEAQNREQHIKRDLDRLARDLKQLKESKGPHQRAAQFGGDMPKVLDALARNKQRFQKLPVGPIGMYLQIKDPQWGIAVESALGGLVATFVVDNHQDRKAFEVMCRDLRLGWVPQMLVMRIEDRPYDLPAARMPDASRYTRMYDVLSFTHPMAQQVCVDRANVERAILAPGFDEAKELMWTGGTPHNVSKCYTQGGYAIYTRGSIQAQDKPGTTGARSRLCADASEQIRMLEAELEGKKEEFEECRRQSHGAVHARQTFDRMEKELVAKLGKLRKQIRAHKDALDQLNSGAGAEEASVEEALEEARLMDAEAQARLEAADKLREEVRALERDIAPLAAQIRDLEAECNALATQLEQSADLIQQAWHKRKKLEKGLEKINSEISNAEAERAKRMAELQRAKRAAADAEAAAREGLAPGAQLPHVDERATIGGIQNQLTRMQRRKEEAQKAAGRRRSKGGIERVDVESLRAAYEEANAVLETEVKKAENVRADMSSLKKARKTRDRQWSTDRIEMGEQVSGSFDYEMRTRQLAGSLQFDHQDDSHNSKLAIQVQTSSVDNNANTTQNVATLSGGERSFTTMAFQIAMWTFVDVPFRCMDEFDVFMDDAFRRQAVTSLLAACDSHPTCQFMFLTPQDMTSMIKDDDKARHVFRMPNPRED